MARIPKHRDLFPGALEVMILQSLRLKPMHGYALVNHIKQVFDDLLQVEEDSLYPALQRMLKEGWLEAETGTSTRAAPRAFTGLRTRVSATSKKKSSASKRCSLASRACSPLPRHRSPRCDCSLRSSPSPPLRRYLGLDPGAHRKANEELMADASRARKLSRRRGANSATWPP
jgi:hypothetical protein